MTMKKFNFSLTKREKIIITSVILSLGLVSTQLVPVFLRYRFITGLAILCYLLSLWALWEGINRIKAVVLMILPVMFTIAFTSYYFLLPVRWLTRLPAALIFGVIFYILLLSQNVFNVSAIRTIPLYRVASTTIFVLTLISAFLLFNVVFSMELLAVWNGLFIFILSFLLIIQIIWSVEMEGLNWYTVIQTLILALVMGEVGLVLSFWPIYKPMASLALSTILFITLGVTTHVLRERLSRGVVWEYLGWGILVFLIATMTTSWTG